MERTFSIIKPDATKRNITGKINQIIEQNGLRIIAQKRLKLSINQAKKFYSVHSERSFFNDLMVLGTLPVRRSFGRFPDISSNLPRETEDLKLYSLNGFLLGRKPFIL